MSTCRASLLWINRDWELWCGSVEIRTRQPDLTLINGEGKPSCLRISISHATSRVVSRIGLGPVETRFDGSLLSWVARP